MTAHICTNSVPLGVKDDACKLLAPPRNQGRGSKEEKKRAEEAIRRAMTAEAAQEAEKKKAEEAEREAIRQA